MANVANDIYENYACLFSYMSTCLLLVSMVKTSIDELWEKMIIRSRVWQFACVSITINDSDQWSTNKPLAIQSNFVALS